MGVLQYADGSHFVLALAGLWSGDWLGSDLVNGLFGWLGIGFVDSWFTGFVQSAKWSVYSWVYISCATVISFQYPSLRAWGDIRESKQQSLPLESLRKFR